MLYTILLCKVFKIPTPCCRIPSLCYAINSSCNKNKPFCLTGMKS